MIKRLILLMMCFIATDVLAQKLLRDPTKPANVTVVVNEDGEAVEDVVGILNNPGNQPVIPSGKLSAIVVTELVKYAIINNEVVYEGQPWRNAILSEVRPYSIILTLDEQKKEIKINDTSFITEVNYEF